MTTQRVFFPRATGFAPGAVRGLAGACVVERDAPIDQIPSSLPRRQRRGSLRFSKNLINLFIIERLSSWRR